MKLSNATLRDLPEEVSVPAYDRTVLTPGIVHIGVGNFHRAHQAWYLHRLMQQGKALDWAIIGAGVRDYDSAQRDKLAAQDYLTTLIELDPSGTSAEVVGAMVDYVPIEDGNRALIHQLSDPRIRIVSLTVTEGGYFLDPADKRFSSKHPDIQYDVHNTDTPRTAFGAIVAALKTRRAAGVGPFTCMSCDNLPGNGRILKEVVIGLAKLSDPDLAQWIAETVSFPNSMVDCIVPATGPEELALARDLGVDDTAPVTHENFRQWVIEDDFCAGRPALEEVGVTVSDRVHAYEAMKLQLLNGGHQVVANPAEILGLHTIADAMQSTQIKGLFRKVALKEILPHIAPVPEIRPAAYVDLVDARFSNPAMIDTVRRVAFDGSSRHTGAVLPIIRTALAEGTPTEGLALSQALWARMCQGTREDGSVIEPNDPDWAQLFAVANAAKQTPNLWLEQRNIYGDIAENVGFSAAFSRFLTGLYTDGVEVTIANYLAS